ncbi:carboxypeptidase regulatory-like domain-containing protein [Variovorax sp. Varisp62]|uniref:carboxypeptidase regulatory-like domain-containing protein n=1 Tax=Variovorax sp. Varisp62 TaxID=3243049 RepID=UPI0039B3B29A
MTSFKKTLCATAASTSLVLLAACGGGGGGGSGAALFPIAGSPPAAPPSTPPSAPPASNPPQTSSQLSGVAATGAPFAGANIVVVDQTGATVCTTQTDSAGAYACALPASAKAPFVITAQRDDLTLYSTTASTTGGTANVSPLTTIIVSRLSPDGNPASLAGAIQANPGALTAASIQQQVTSLVAALQPLLSTLGQGTLDPVSGVFVADGTGPDKVLDAISVSVRPDGTAANIEITVKTVPATEGSAPVSITFRSSDSNTPTLPPIAAGDLAQVPSPAAVAALFDKVTACFALPLSQRVNAPNDTSAVTGTATDVIAPACRTMFVGDDPGTYYQNGSYVGRDSSNAGAFAGLFRPGTTGLKWDRGNFEHVRANGDLLLSYRTTDVSGNVDYDTIVARNVNGTLKLSGNGYTYAARVRPYSEHRELINTPDFSYYTTGYNVNIDNKTDGNGNSIFSQVVLTTPTGSTRVYLPTAGLSYLVAAKDDGVTPTSGSVFRLRGEYQNTATAGNPSDRESSLFFLSPQYSDAQISALNDQSVWKLEFVPVGGAVGNPGNVTQSYRTLSRAQSIGEIRQVAFVGLTAAMRSQLISASSATGNIVFGAPSQNDPNLIDFSADGNLDAWTVPQGALPPTSFTAYGRAPSPGPGQQGARFNDSTGVASQARSVVLRCSTQTVNDLHCDNSLGLQYAAGTSVNNFELWARTSRQLEVSKKVALYEFH